MPKIPHPKQPPLAQPSISRKFDPWNSSSTGHQRSESRGPQGWRESPNMKMNAQFRAGYAGGDRISDTVGVGSEDYDESLKMLVPKELRMRAEKSVADMLRNPGSMKSLLKSQKPKPVTPASPILNEEDDGLTPEEREAIALMEAEDALQRENDDGLTPEEREAFARMEEEDQRRRRAESTPDTTLGDIIPPSNQEAFARTQEKAIDSPQKQRKIFDGLTTYINGSTFPLISDHRLKQLLAENGARISLHLGRRQVTHVILGKPANGPRSGAGGGLAGGKIEKEIRRLGGCGVKYVGVEWVLESIKVGKRQPETRFSNLKIAPRGQQSVFGAFSKAD
ncbi:hypothetical protein QBC38DRAFT_441121 [Podospora fimiseda]|uniref:BRCT domain-containing protein n=1 Tax=Podospora fimiseda TaxID=252190 RepID=A0AAN7BV93_9PEZI|nr:hypothetical protein QBC38DRAFT_441121 [Podospora fimiseda]